MAVVTLTDVEVAVQDAVGTSALLQGRALARAGKVDSIRSDPEGRIRGRVLEGSREQDVRLFPLRGPDGSLDVREAWCSCGAEMPCRHAAALFLADAEAGTTERTGPPDRGPGGASARPGVQPWERALRAALTEPGASKNRSGSVARSGRGTGTSPDPGRPPIALQFEVADGPGADMRVAVRLVASGRSGGWVRSGVSWTSLAHAEYYLRHVPAGQVRLLREMQTLATGHGHGHDRGYGYGYGYRSPDKVLYLDDVVSRRVWDLLLEAQESGLPMVMAGRRAEPVRVHSEPAAARLVVRRDGEDLVAEPMLQTGGWVVGAHLPIGAPPHGIAWFPDSGVGGLHLARLATVPPTMFTRLAGSDPLRVPVAEQDHFLTTYYPQVAQHVEVFCPDGSVALPVAAPPSLELTLTALGDHRLQLDWGWIYRLGDARRREPLALPAGPVPPGRDAAAEARALGEVTSLMTPLTGVVPDDADDVLPVGRAQLEGIETARLMTEVVPLLRARPDVEVRVVPQAGPVPDYREVDTAPVIAFTPAAGPDDGVGAGEPDWFDLAVTVTVDGHGIPFDQLFVALAQGQSHLLLDSGVWFSLEREEFAELARVIAESRELLDAPSGAVRLSRFHAGLWEEIENLGVITGQVDAWRERVAALNGDRELPDLKLPAGLEATLRPYQEDGFHRLATLFTLGLGGILADDMGLGKTVQTLALILHTRERADERAADRPFLVVAPTSVVANWSEQAARFAPDLSVATITQTTARRGQEIPDLCAGADLVVTSYTLFRLEYQQYQQVEWAGLVLDEAQNVKNHHSAGYRCARELPAGFKLAITGTPMENNLMELWSLLSITAAGLFPRPERFTDYYRTPIERNRDADRLAQLRRRIRPLVLRRSKEQVAADLPERQEQVLELPLQTRHRAVYQTYLQRERQKVLGLLGDLNRNRFEILRSLTLLRQASIDPALVDPAHHKVPSTKLDALMDQLDHIVAEGHRVLVFSQFTRFLTRVADRLDHAGVEYCYLDGKTRRRAEVVSRFREGIAPVFLISLKAGGTGLNLTEADYVILLDPWWNPAVEAQAVDRTHRIGQTRNVMVYRMVAKDTIEEKVMALKERKAALTASVLDGDDLASSALTADDIRGLLT